MPWASVVLTPGVNVEQTATMNQAAYVKSENGRFKAGLFQKLGGWMKYVSAVFPGTIRHLWGWLDLNNNKRLSVASTLAVTVVTNGELADITPQLLDTSGTPDFSTTSGSAIVEIQDTDTSGLTTDDAVELRTPVSVGGIILSGVYPIASITGADSYTIIAASPATATVANGGAVPAFNTISGSAVVSVDLNDHGQSVGNTVVFPIATTVGGVVVQGKYTVIGVTNANSFDISVSTSATSTAGPVSMNAGEAAFTYYIAVGPVSGGIGYGLGGYGDGGYGLGTSGSAVQLGAPLVATDWTQDNWGEILMACPEGGGIYYWQPGSGFQNLKLIAEAPLYNKGMFLSMAQQQVFAFGAAVDARQTGGIGIYRDPLLVSWSDIGNFFSWFPTVDNFARSSRIPTGSMCVGGAASKNRNLIWTDLDIYAFVFNGGDSVYTPNRVGSNCGLIGEHAWGQHADTMYWMGVGNFFSYSGSGVQPIPCSVWDDVFQNLHPDFQHTTQCGPNSDFTEIWWWYPSLTGGGLRDRFAKFNIVEGTWDNGPMDRCAWLDRSVLGYPIGASSAGLVYSHEKGFDDDGAPLVPLFETGDFYIDEGEDFVFIDEVYPDFKWGISGGSENAQIEFTLLCKDSAGETPREYGPFVATKALPSIQPFTIDADGNATRIRCRQLAMRVRSIDVGSFWRLGKVRFRYSPDGKR